MKSLSYVLYLLTTIAVPVVYAYNVRVEKANVYRSQCGLLPSNNDNGHTFLMSKELWNEVKEKLAQEGYTKIPYKMKHCFMDQYNDGTGDYNMAGFMIGGTAVYLRKDDEQDNFTLFLPNNE